MNRIVINLPRDRNIPGTIRVQSDSDHTIAGPWPVLGKSSRKPAEMVGNPNRDPKLALGHSPTGEYRVEGLRFTGQGTHYPVGSYGPHGAIRLTPTSGEAKIAANNLRTGIMIHAGALLPSGGLKATLGCFRLSNDHMRELLISISVIQATDPCNTCSATLEDMRVVVSDGGE